MFIAITVGLTFLLILALLLPVGLELQIGDQEATQAAASKAMRLTWAGGLLSVNVRPRPAARASAPPAEPSKQARRTRKAPREPARLLRVLQSRGFLGAAAGWLGKLLRATHPRDLWVRAALGLDDPADTGHLWSLLGPVSAVLWSASQGAVTLQPDFSRARTTISGHGRFTVIPAQLLWLTFAFALSPVVLRAARAASRTKRR